MQTSTIIRPKQGQTNSTHQMNIQGGGRVALRVLVQKNRVPEFKGDLGQTMSQGCFVVPEGLERKLEHFRLWVLRKSTPVSPLFEIECVLF